MSWWRAGSSGRSLKSRAVPSGSSTSQSGNQATPRPEITASRMMPRSAARMRERGSTSSMRPSSSGKAQGSLHPSRWHKAQPLSCCRFPAIRPLEPVGNGPQQLPFAFGECVRRIERGAKSPVKAAIVMTYLCARTSPSSIARSGCISDRISVSDKPGATRTKKFVDSSVAAVCTIDWFSRLKRSCWLVGYQFQPLPYEPPPLSIDPVGLYPHDAGAGCKGKLTEKEFITWSIEIDANVIKIRGE